MSEVAMQERCIYCKREQYAPAVYSISHAEHPCAWCGKVPPQLTQADYAAIHRGEVVAPEARSAP